MAFLQPWMLWALPAVLLPVVIHLLNRLRYKTVPWAAMPFLRKANRAATRRAKIRQYLILASRMLAILFLIWALSRPLTGGWLGAAASGAPETILILLDRSASMEAHPQASPESKRSHALSLLTQAASQNPGSHFALIENVLRQPLELPSASSLSSLQFTAPTDTAADLPAMLRSALDYLVKNKPGNAEIWIASDLQTSNWRPDSPEWQDIVDRFTGLPQQIKFRVLDLSSTSTQNLSVAVQSADLRLRPTKNRQGQLHLALEVKTPADRQGILPILITRDGTKTQVDLTLSSTTQRQSLQFDLPKLESGWGKVELPADDSLTDHSAYFAYAPPPTLHTVIVGDSLAAQRLLFAAAPDKTRPDRTAILLPPNRAESIAWANTSLIIWTASTPTAPVEKSLKSWVESGGVLLCFPPSDSSTQGPLGLAWSKIEASTQDTPFRVGTWDDLDGPLAHTESGPPLPLPKLEIPRRQIPTTDSSHSVATFSDGPPFLLTRKLGTGLLAAFATLPDPQWSNLADGFVLLPAVQRLISLGGQRLSPPNLAVAGEWQPPDPLESWTALSESSPHDWRWNAGVYQSGSQRLALNRPAIEDLPEKLDPTSLPTLFHDLNLTVMTNALNIKADSLQSEIWTAMILVTMLFMCAEMALATSKAVTSPATPTPPPTTRASS